MSPFHRSITGPSGSLLCSGQAAPATDRRQRVAACVRTRVAVMALGFAMAAGVPAIAQDSLRATLPSDQMLGTLGLQRAWWGQATLDPVIDRVQFFTTDEQSTFVQSTGGMVTAFDNANGRRLWSVQIGDPTEVRYQLAANDQWALLVCGTRFYALDRKTGGIAWEVAIPSAPSTGPGLDDTMAYIGSIKGSIYAFNLKILGRMTKDNTLARDAYRALTWRFHTGNRVAFPPVSTGSVVSVASRDGSVYGLITSDHKLRYQFETDRPVSAPLAQSGPQIIVATGDMKVYCISADLGSLKWELLTGLEVRRAPRVIGANVFLEAEGGGIHCLDAATGRKVWSNSRARDFLAATTTLLYAFDEFDNVLLINRADGHLVGSFALPRFSVRLANDRTDRILLASERGLVVCIRERDREFPLFHKRPEKRPVLPDVMPDSEAAATKPGAKPADREKPSATAKPAATPQAAPAKPSTPPVRKPPTPPATKKPASDDDGAGFAKPAARSAPPPRKSSTPRGLPRSRRNKSRS